MKKYFFALFFLFCSLLFILGADVYQTHLKCPNGLSQLTEYRLFFGRNGPHGQEVVSRQAWESFLEKTVTPLFPDGLTVYDAKGQWTDSLGKLIRENSKVILILTFQDKFESIQKITSTYKKLFQQESVFVLSNLTCGAF